MKSGNNIKLKQFFVLKFKLIYWHYEFRLGSIKYRGFVTEMYNSQMHHFEEINERYRGR